MNSRERRQHKRLAPPEGSYAAIPGDLERVGRIVDISRGGLAFHYIKDPSFEPEEGFSNLRVDVFICGKWLMLDNLPCRVVRDSLCEEETGFQTDLCLRQCGVQFTDLSHEQENRLNGFLSNCATAIRA